MGPLEITSLCLIMLIGAAIPSSSVVLVVARSLSHGVPNGISASLGIVVGDLIFILLVIYGLSEIAESVGWLFLLIKYVGAIYLIWLGLTLLISKPSAIDVEKRSHKGALVSSFLAGLFLTLGDVKAIFFYIALFPAFINLAELSSTDVALVVIIDIVLVGGIKVFYACSATKVVSLAKKHGLESRTKKVAGGFMVGAGGYLMIKA